MINRQEGIVVTTQVVHTVVTAGFQISDTSVSTFLNQELMKLKCHRFIVLTFVVQQLLLLDDLSLEAFFSLYTTTCHTEVQESPAIVMTYNYPSLLVCTSLE